MTQLFQLLQEVEADALETVWLFILRLALTGSLQLAASGCFAKLHFQIFQSQLSMSHSKTSHIILKDNNDHVMFGLYSQPSSLNVISS